MSAASSEMSGLRVVVAEDEPFQRLVLERLLAGLGAAEVRSAGDGMAALSLLEDMAAWGPVDLLICDLEMPELDGLELIKIVRRMPSPDWRHLSILVLTAHLAETFNQRAQEAGADGFLVKPVTRADLLAQVAAARARHAASSVSWSSG